MASIVIDPADAFSLDATTAQGVRQLVSTAHYWMREHRLDGGTSELAATPGPSVLSVARGTIRLGSLELSVGTTAIVPASSDVTSFEGSGAVVLEMGF